MPTNLQKIVIPTGFESERRKAEQKRKIAAAMMSNGLSQHGDYTSWTQVLGQMANAWAGKRLDKKSEKMDAETDQKISDAYANAVAGLNADVAAGKTPQEIMAAQAGNPLLEGNGTLEAVKDAAKSAMVNKEKLIDFNGRTGIRQGDVMGQVKMDPNDKVIMQDGKWVVNPVAATAGLAAQGMAPVAPGLPVGQGISAMDAPGSSPAPAIQAGGGPAGGTDDPLSAFNPEERKVIMSEAMRRRQTGAAPNNIPSGSPLAPGAVARPPAGVTKDGKPVWLINGEYYDNPEGR